MSSRSISYASPKPTGGAELWSWLFMRLSGVALLVMTLGHLALMHLINTVDTIDYNFVAGRYTGWWWRAYDGTLLVLAMIHGLNGARILLDDYLAHRRWHRAAVRALYVTGILFLLLGLYVVIWFQPAAHP